MGNLKQVPARAMSFAEIPPFALPITFSVFKQRFDLT